MDLSDWLLAVIIYILIVVPIMLLPYLLGDNKGKAKKRINSQFSLCFGATCE